MTQLGSREALQLLADIEDRSRKFAAGLPKEKVKELWEGVLFTVVGLKMIAPLDEVKEILNYPPAVTRVPGAKDWVSGVANIRGSLLPIIDLQSYFGGKHVAIGRRSRVLVINHEGLYTGLLVADVEGMRHFSEDQANAVPALPEKVAPFIEKAYEYEGGIRPVFSMNRLAEDSDFRVAAL